MIKRLSFYLSIRSYKILGAEVYFFLIKTLFTNVFSILKARDFSVVDSKVFLKFPQLNLKFDEGIIHVDINKINGIAHSKGQYIFAGIREIILKNCYFHGIPKEILVNAKNVIDLGANMGIFSLYSTLYAERIISVEVQSEFKPIYNSLMEQNNFQNHQLYNCFIGAGGQMSNNNSFKSLAGIMDEAAMHEVDFLKVDIEGSEYKLFETDFPYERIRCILMELHPEFGSNEDLRKRLSDNSFNCVFYNDLLEETKDYNKATYLKAIGVSRALDKQPINQLI